MSNTPGNILADYIDNKGGSEFTIEPIDPDTGILSGATDLGNGNQVYDFISQTTDGVYCAPGNEIDFMSCNLQDWDNLSRFYTGQHTAPAAMHDSEYVGGKLAEDMARVPGEYYLPYIMWWCDSNCDCGGDGVLPGGDYCELDIEGWLVMYRDIFDTEESH